MKSVFPVIMLIAFCSLGYSNNYPEYEIIDMSIEVTDEVYVLIYGARPAGIMAAVTIKNAGLSVIIVEPGNPESAMLSMVENDH
jgi:NADPH-dependent 2,4-dienoyl-CoA reductase/sulfur reductase-like enzyme